MAAETIETTELTQDVLDLIALTESRARTYGMLSRLYKREVDEELLARMVDTLYPAATGNDDIDKGYLMIATYLSNMWDDSVSELAVDYHRTFIGHGVDAYSAAYPVESVYTSETRLLVQNARDDVLAAYRKAGLGKAPDWKDNDDHIALELDYMQILCTRAAEALGSGDENTAVELFADQRAFLREHLLAWVPMFTSDIRRFAQTEMCQGLSWLTDGFLQVEDELLANLLSEPEEE